MEEHIQFSDAEGALVLLDQRYLPTKEDWYTCKNVDEVIYALQTMVVRGAPAIGVTAGYGCWIAAKEASSAGDNWIPKLEELLDKLENARPTAVNLRWGVERMKGIWQEMKEADPNHSLSELAARWLTEAKLMHEEDKEINRVMGAHGGALLKDGDVVMTHCNAGALATAGYGTALGVVRGAVDQGKKIEVIANETRPFLQGARLTAYELKRDNIPVTVACDNATSLLMRKGKVSAVVVGADRIAANGDIANKIGTSGVAILAKEYGVPFYVAAPLSTIDRRTPTGDEIPIEERVPDEVTHVGETRITPDGVPVFNYAFDITPNAFVAGIITEMGVLRPPFIEAIKEAFARAGK
jgi:methylthioribose-1-phosphate isomerase